MQIHNTTDDHIFAMIRRQLCPECEHPLRASGSFDPYDGEGWPSMFCPNCGWDEDVWRETKRLQDVAAEKELEKRNMDKF